MGNSCGGKETGFASAQLHGLTASGRAGDLARGRQVDGGLINKNGEQDDDGDWNPEEKQQ